MTEQKAPAVRGITPHEFSAWRHHAVTKLFLQYLRDKRAFIERAVLDRWISGALTLQADQTIRGQIIELAELSDLPFEALQEFYREEEGANAAPTH